MSSDDAVPAVSSHSLRSSSRLDASSTSRYTVFTTSPSQQLYSRRAHSPSAVSRSTSLRSEGSTPPARDDITATFRPLAGEPQARLSLSSRPRSSRYSTELLQPHMQSTTASQDQEQSRYARPGSTLSTRRRSWFRDDDPSAFGPTSSDPAALSPMATFRSSMSEDERQDELFSASSSPSLHPTQSLKQKCQTPPPDPHRNPAIQLSEKSLLAPPSRARARARASSTPNPEVIINFASEDSVPEDEDEAEPDPDIPRRASDSDRSKFDTNTSPAKYSLFPTSDNQAPARTPSPDATTTRGGLVSGPRVQKRSAWDRALRRGDSSDARGSL